MRRILLYSVASMLLSNTLLAENARPNIILVMVDDQGYGDVGYNGHPFLKTPHLNEMAANSVRLDQFYAAAPVCSPTRASVFTGRTPMRTNVLNHGHYMRPHELTLSEVLKQSGYVTGHFGKWHIGSVQKQSPTSPAGVGFDYSLTGLNFFDVNPYLARNGKFEQVKGQGTVITMDTTLEFLKQHKDEGKPMFAVTWFPSPHDPHKEKPVDFKGAKALYKDAKEARGYYLEITLLDQQIGRLRKALREMKIADNTIIWYCSDNGGLLKSSSGGREKKGSIYEGGLRVPCLVEWPIKLKPKTLKLTSSTMDMYPTLLSFAGIDSLTTHQPKLDGIDLTAAIYGKQVFRPAIGFWHGYEKGQGTWNDRIIKSLMEAQRAGKTTPHPKRILKNVNAFPKRDKSLLKGHSAWNAWPWKLHRIQSNKGVKVELYHLVNDPMEKVDLSEVELSQRVKLLGQLENWQRSVLRSLEGADY